MSAYRYLADAVLLVHALFVAFVVVGQGLILAGLALGWRWVRDFRFRVAHLVAIGIVVAQAWVGVLCPLTLIENQLRRMAGQRPYQNSFIQHWLHQLIFYEAEGWVFTVIYTLFGLVVALTWWFGRPLR